ncbi:MAG: phosphoribosylaminoimidazolesuccinocarboxamide synthase [Planctomycetota bacterium]|nr:phosphoribosylaminoimidazolesuccinocarboxamide synthase [Planctomycetota bacterium]MDA1106017.1 phosphoribosylaminoimidazolesuccinocarboxamide synthase [Planctomycetota bacterium]
MATEILHTVFSTDLPLSNPRRGKVRDMYSLPPDADGPRVLMVATDRVSAFDVVMPTPIPGKGCLLTAISAGWFDWLRTQRIIEDHVLSLNVPSIPGTPVSDLAALEGRIMCCRAVKIIPIECVARGYLAGSGWSEYKRDQTVCGIPLPAGLRQGDRLPKPIFTPATKAESGHDENISFKQACQAIGEPLASRLRDVTLRLYASANAHAAKKGVILADTKFEFGFALDADGNPTDRLLLADEVLTPDSSRYWPADTWNPGQEQVSYDKQFLREYLLQLEKSGQWDRTPPGPELPAEVVEGTLARYREAAQRLFSTEAL